MLIWTTRSSPSSLGLVNGYPPTAALTFLFLPPVISALHAGRRAFAMPVLALKPTVMKS
jgi:hypothetical protein